MMTKIFGRTPKHCRPSGGDKIGGYCLHSFIESFEKDIKEIAGTFTYEEHNEIVRALNENHDPAIDRIDRTKDGNVKITFKYIPDSIRHCKGIQAYLLK